MCAALLLVAARTFGPQQLPEVADQDDPLADVSTIIPDLVVRLAYATPRRWLLPGRRIVVRGARTSFGSLSYSLVARKASVRVRLTVPRRVRPAALRLRLRLPVGKRITSVSVGGRAFERFDSGSGTIDLSGLKGRVDLVASYS